MVRKSKGIVCKSTHKVVVKKSKAKPTTPAAAEAADDNSDVIIMKKVVKAAAPLGRQPPKSLSETKAKEPAQQQQQQQPQPAPHLAATSQSEPLTSLAQFIARDFSLPLKPKGKFLLSIGRYHRGQIYELSYGWANQKLNMSPLDHKSVHIKLPQIM